MRSLIAVVAAVAACSQPLVAGPSAHDPSPSGPRSDAAVAADAQRWEARADYEFPRTLPSPEPAPSPTSSSGWCLDYTGWCLKYGDLIEPSDVDRLPVEAWGAIEINYGGSCGRQYEPALCRGPISGRFLWTPDDHRVVARAGHLLADDHERRGMTEEAHYARKRADGAYAYADRLEGESGA